MINSIVLLLSTLAFTCKAPPPRLADNRPPELRIGIIEEREAVEFKVDGKFSLSNRGAGFVLRDIPGGHWRIETIDSKPARFEYRLAVGTTRDRREAEDIVAFMSRQGLTTEIKKYKLNRRYTLPQLHDATYQVLVTRRFQTEQAAREHQKQIRDKSNSDIVRIARGEPRGKLRFTNLGTKYTFDSRKPVRLDALQVEIAQVDVGTGFHWQRSEARKYTGGIEFVLDDTGNITVVNELSLESYVRGVVPSEMPASFPLEALKAQAVTARVEALSKIGVRHPVEPFDLCDDVHCQAFSGVTKHNDITDNAVTATRGMVMVYRGKLTEAFYAGVCGGHTENNDNVWITNPRAFLRGTLDRAGKQLSTSLEQEENVRRWIDSKPQVYCNTTEGNVPRSVNYSKKYFRWQVDYSRAELETIIRKKTGTSFGSLVDLRPLKRGVSGRLIELEVVGTRKKFTITKELPIRQALSLNTLYSACFYVTTRGGTNGLPARFVLKGAGWGHGVGMCQVGAAMMAHSGQTFDRILTHYYSGIKLERLYK